MMSEHDAIQLRRRAKATYPEFRAAVDDLYRRWQDGHVNTLDFHVRLEEITQRFDGIDRVTCLCGTSYLRTVEGFATLHYGYRLERLGLDSELLYVCSDCGRTLDG